MGRVAVYYEAAAVITSLTLLGQILELNARPGLNIQIANDCGLTLRTQAVEKHLEELAAEGLVETVEERTRFVQALFGHVPAVTS